ncbi:MAG: universal stress protein [Sphaerobacteraceae bacterium]|nr:MAG: universal stress protein [Sphaerobacteraceae bacterium]
MLKRIVVPLDGSQISHAALPLARSLAEQTGAGVTLVSVIDPPRDFYISPQDSSSTRLRPKDIDHLAKEEQRLDYYLKNVATSFERTRVSTDIRLGQAATEILEAAEAVEGSAIVMASHGRSGLGRMLMGSVAERIVQSSQVPVFVTRASTDTRAEFGKQKITNVAVALDGSDLAEQALDRAYDIFRNNVRYTLVRIVEPVAPGQSYSSEIIANYEREARESAEDYVRDAADTLTTHGATVSADVRITEPASGITRVASEFGADLIAMTTHGRSGMGRFLLGSVAERVLHDTDRPVMIVRAKESNSES